MRVGPLDIDLPETWEDRSLYTYVAPVTDVSPSLAVRQSTFQTNVVFQQRRLEEGETLDDCVERARQNTDEMFGGPKISIADGPMASGIPFKRLTYSVIDGVTNQPVAQVLYVGCIGPREWQVAFSVAAIQLDQQLPAFDRIIASARLAS
jgi:hypothetical protein